MPFHLSENELIGGTVLILSLWGLIKDQWFLANTRKGQRLLEWFGPGRAIWVLRLIFLIGIIFGALLATGLIQPIQWE
ncbi:hypothetical protein [Gimesia fumaroli]|uniref:Uncharacterized protein n=1 Tax=Gimesia fumaroli TaxID=2527976 RepID=A0A518IED0_9PLAN|nr:hypothetical protein [Gimesia fumaroli]QDV51461.1 hypothetical protein Enr17x_35170 [Gimesia fumaroli]